MDLEPLSTNKKKYEDFIEKNQNKTNGNGKLKSKLSNFYKSHPRILLGFEKGGTRCLYFTETGEPMESLSTVTFCQKRVGKNIIF